MTEATNEVSPTKTTNDGTRWGKMITLWLRRCHLYLGLFLAPWALLYGITGYLFNHPTHFSDRGLKEISSSDLATSGFDGTLPDPLEAAEEVISKLNERFPESKLVIAEASDARYVGDFFFATANGTEKTYQLLIRRDGGGGTYMDSTVPKKTPPPEAEFVINLRGGASSKGDAGAAAVEKPEPLKIERGAAAKVEAILPELAKRLELPGLDKPFRLTSAPQLQFRASSHGKTWLIKYDSFLGGVSAEWEDPALAKEPLSWRAYLLRLHTAHGYMGIFEARWFWAWIVDAMSFVMVFWALSGFIMWWQIKRLRTLGWIVIGSSVIAAAALFFAMAYELH